MTLPALATTDDLFERIGGEIENGLRVESLLAYASSLVRRYTRRTFLDDVGDLVDPLPDGVNEVVVSMVERVIDNPGGVTQETTGPFTASFGASAAERIYLSAGDKIILGPVRLAAGLGVIATTRGPVETPTGSDCIGLFD